MDYKTLQMYIYEMNEDEKFYKNYYFAKQQQYSLEKFLAELDFEDVMKRHLLVTEIPETIPPVFEDYFFFDPIENNSITAMKHNRYSPALFHNHTFFELVYVYDGTCKQKFLHTEYELHTGDICIIPPGIDHSIWVNDESIILNILIKKDRLHNIFFNFLNTKNILSSFFLNNIYAHRANDYIIFHTGNDYEMRRGFLYILWETINKALYYDELMGSTLMLIFGLLIRNYENTAEMPIFAHKTDVQRYALIHYIQENYATVRLEDVARKFHYTPEYTSKLIKETTGMTFTEITQQVRIEKAQDMLLNTNMPIANISADVGYEATEHFIRIFKKHMKMTPSQFRKMHSK